MLLLHVSSIFNAWNGFAVAKPKAFLLYLSSSDIIVIVIFNGQ